MNVSAVAMIDDEDDGTMKSSSQKTSKWLRKRK